MIQLKEKKDQLKTHISNNEEICFESHETKNKQPYAFETSIILH